MAVSANDPVGKVNSMIIKSVDANGNEYETAITTSSGKIAINPATTYTKVDTSARALNYLSTNTYRDTTLITQYSVNEILAE